MSIDVAKKLAEITGKPLEFFLGEIHDAKKSTKIVVGEKILREESKSKYASDDVKVGTSKNCSDTEDFWTTEELLEFQKMFADSKISNNGYILYGRQMTRKEYLKLTRGLNQDELMYHPLHYKMFRAEGQTEGFYLRWIDKFPEATE